MFSPPTTLPPAEPLGSGAEGTAPPPGTAGAPFSAAAPLADGRPRRLDPRYVPCARIGGGIFALLLLLAEGVGLGAVALMARRPVFLPVLGLSAAALLVLVALSAWLYPPLKLRHCTWRLSSAGLEIRRGVWFRHLVSVPRARVQHTDVERGPLERRFDLATLVVHTAGHQNSEIRLEGLEHGTALAIRDHLLGSEGGAGGSDGA